MLSSCINRTTHPWIKNYNWAALSEKACESPFIPNPNTDNFDKRHVMKEEDTSDEDPMILRRNSIQQLFDGYEYDNLLGQEMSDLQVIVIFFKIYISFFIYQFL